MKTRRFLKSCLILAISYGVLFPMPGISAPKEHVEKRVLGSGPKRFKIGLDPGTFPPYTSGEFKGIDYEVLKAVCEANHHMRCIVQLRDFSECNTENGVGEALEKGKIDACINWIETPDRIVEGFEFAETVPPFTCPTTHLSRYLLSSYPPCGGRKNRSRWCNGRVYFGVRRERRLLGR